MGNIQEIGQKIKNFFADRREDLYLILVITLVAILAFALGRLSVIYGEKEDFKIIYPKSQAGAALVGSKQLAVTSSDSLHTANSELPPLPKAGGQYVASRSGTAYYFPWCGTALNIKEGNRVYFSSDKEAQKAGYKAGNCKGL